MKLFGLETHKFADIFPMITGEELEQLKQDIKEHGLLQPIILFEGQILDGRNRFKACKEIGVNPAFVDYKGDKPLEYVISENLKRRHLTASQRAVIAVDCLPLLEEEARKRMSLGGGDKKSGMVKLPQPIQNKGKSSVQAGKLARVGEKYVRAIKKLRDAGKKEEIEEIRQGTKTVQDIKKEERTAKVQKQIETIKQDNLQKPTGEYDVIVIDPPWKVDFDYSPDHYMGRVANPYPEMTVEQIKNIKLPTKTNSILWLWTTHSQIWNAIEILRFWGFEYKCLLVWDKESMGIGKWLRKQCEFCLLGIKGKPVWTATDVRDIIREQKTKHSAKPEGFYKMVDDICVGKKLDYFARKKRDGWSVYGDEINVKEKEE